MGVQPQYFLDTMEVFELEALLEQYYQQYKDNWEQVRLMCYYTAAPWSEHLKLTDVLKFNWDDKEVQPSKEERNRAAEDLLKMFREPTEYREYLPLI